MNNTFSYNIKFFKTTLIWEKRFFFFYFQTYKAPIRFFFFWLSFFCFNSINIIPTFTKKQHFKLNPNHITSLNDRVLSYIII